MMNDQRVGNVKLGALILIMAFMIGASQNALIKSIRMAYPAVVIVFIQYGLCLLMLFPNILKSRLALLKSRRKGLLIFRALSGLGYCFGMFAALKTSSLVDVTLLSNMGPLWVPLVCLLWMGTPISWRIYSGILIGLLGVVFVLMPDHHVFTVGSMLAIGSSVCMAVAMVSTRQLTQTENSQSMPAYYFLVSAFVTLPFAVLYWKTPSLFQCGILLMNGVLMFIQQYLINVGFRLGPADQLSITSASGVVFSAFLGWVFWNEIITPVTILGALLVCYGSYKSIITSRSADIKAMLKRN